MASCYLRLLLLSHSVLLPVHRSTSNRLKTIFTFIDISCFSYEKKRVNGANPKPVSSLQGPGPDLQNSDPSLWDPDSDLTDPDSGLQKTNSDLPKLKLSL